MSDPNNDPRFFALAHVWRASAMPAGQAIARAEAGKGLLRGILALALLPLSAAVTGAVAGETKEALAERELRISRTLSGFAAPVPSAAPASGPAAVPADRLALSELVRAAFARHPAIASARAQREAAEKQRSAARQGFLPSLSLALGQGNNDGRANSVAVTQPLWTGGRLTGELEGAGHRLTAAEAALRETEQRLAEQVVMLALELQRHRAVIEIGQANQETLRRLLQTTERRFREGSGPEADVMMARSRLTQADAQLIQTQTAERRAAARLATLTGESVPAGMLRTDAAIYREMQDAERAVAEALKFSPGVLRMDAEAEAADSDKTVARSRLWPQLALKAEAVDNKWTTTQRDERLLVTLEYQFGAGLSALDRASAADATRRAALGSADRTRLELRERVLADVEEVQGLVPRIGALEKSIATNNALVDSFIRQFNAGKRGWLDVLNMQNELAASKISLEDTRQSALAAAYRISLATGRFFQQAVR